MHTNITNITNIHTSIHTNIQTYKHYKHTNKHYKQTYTQTLQTYIQTLQTYIHTNIQIYIQTNIHTDTQTHTQEPTLIEQAPFSHSILKYILVKPFQVFSSQVHSNILD